MINIGFTQQQAEELKLYYASEISKLTDKLAELQSIYAKFLHQTNDLKTIATPTTNNVDQDKIVERTKPWHNIIFDVIASKHKSISRQDLINEISKIYNLDPIKVGNNVTTSLVKLRTDKLITSKRKGRKILLSVNAENNKEPIVKQKPKKNISKVKEAKTPENIETTDKAALWPKPINWPNFIVTTLNSQKRLMQSGEFTDIAIKQFKVPSKDIKTLRGRLSVGLSKLNLIDKTLKSSPVDGSNKNFYGLTNWFEKGGKVQSEYIPRLTNTQKKNIK